MPKKSDKSAEDLRSEPRIILDGQGPELPVNTAIDQLQDGIVDNRSQFTLLAGSEGLRCDWYVPLCEDPAIKSALSEIEASGDTPVFAVTVLAVVA